MDAPIELIKFDSGSGKFSVDQEAVRMLNAIKGPVAVVAVCGRARQGKSFLLNRLIQSFSGTGNKKGFAVSPYQRPCTKGLWVYSKPILMPHPGPDGRRFHMVLVDCEGIDAYDQSQQYSTQIFSLAVLLSSLFIYNQLGGIDESSLEKLSLVSELTKRIWEKASSSSSGASDTAFSPSFIWLLRDFHLQIMDDGREMSAHEYLEETLQPMQGSNAGSRNEVRSSIKGLFPERDCFALVRPLTDEKQLAKMDTLPITQLRPEFQEGLNQLVNRIKNKARPKRFNGTTATGPIITGLATAFVEALNNGAVPVIASAWQGVVQSECYRALEAANARYDEVFKKDVAAEESSLDLEHQRAVSAGLEVFQQLSLGDAEMRVPYEDKFKQAVGARFKELRARRLAEAESSINMFLADASNKISELMRRPDALETHQLTHLRNELTALLQRYEKTAAGPTKAHRLQQFLLGVVVTGMEGLVKRAVQTSEAAEKKAAALQVELTTAQQRTSTLEQEARSSSSRISHLEQELSAAKQKAAELSSEVQAKAVAAATSAAQVAAGDREAARLREEVAAANKKDVETKAELAQAQQKVTQLTIELSEKTSRSETAQASVSTLEAQCRQLREDAAAERSKYHAAELQVATLRQQLDTTQQQQSQHSSEASQLRNEVTAVRAEASALKAAKEGLEAEVQQSQQRAEMARQAAEAEAARLRAELMRKEEELKAAKQGLEAGVQLSQQRAEMAGRAAEAEAETSRLRLELMGKEEELRRLASGKLAVEEDLRRRMAEAEVEGKRLKDQLNEARMQLGSQQVERVREVEAVKQEAARQLEQQLAAARAQAAEAQAMDTDQPGRKRRRANYVSDMDTDPQPSAPPMPTPSAPPMPFRESPARTPAAPSSSAGPSRSRVKAAKRQEPASTPPTAPTPPPPSSAGKMASPRGAAAPDAPANPEGMSIQQIKSWLTEAGYENDVFELNAAKAKKTDWVKKLREKL